MDRQAAEWTDRILVVDDDDAVRELCADALAEAGFAVESVNSADAALRELDAGRFDVVLTDLRMPGLSGLDLLRAIRDGHSEVDVVLMTAHGTVDTAVESLKLGAYDFLTKPFSVGDLTSRLHRVAEKRQLAAENRVFRQQLTASGGPAGLIGRSPVMERLYTLLGRLAARAQPVLILGESGTGKELAARAIHALGSHPREPFVPVDCGAFSSGLVESELFGHRPGAFTGATQHRIGLLAAAGRGTLFLDEIGELPLDLQTKLLRVLQEREYRPLGGNERIRLDARVVAATNRDLEQSVREGKFRSDLYYRLNVLPVSLPPLRERLEDVPLLAQSFVERECAATGNGTVSGISPAAVRALQAYSWPGNVRELQNHVHRAMAVSPGPLIRLEDLPSELRRAVPAASTSGRAFTRLEKAEREAIREALAANSGHRMNAARQLGIGKTTIYKKLREYGLDA
jgi:DNA-binding NtrC family response regulator